jgi:hypothetical protein
MSDAEDSGPPQMVVTAITLAAGLVAQKVVGVAWRFVRGSDPNDDTSGLGEALAFAAVSAAAMASAKVFATRQLKGRHQLADAS